MTYDDYLLSFHKCDLKEILFDKNILKHFSININFLVLYENQPNLGLELLNEDPDKCLSEWDSATIRAQMSLLKEVNVKCELKSNVHCRIYQLPAWSYINRTFFPDYKDEGKFLQVSGTVMRSSEAKLLKYEHTYLCVKCKIPIIVTADYKRKYMLSEPKVCTSQGCTGKNFIHVDDAKCKDYQEIKIQERVKEVGVGSMPNTMMVTLEDDLVDTCKPGDNVTICGIVKLRFGEFKIGAKIEIDITLKANYLQVDNISSSGTVLTPELRKMFESFWENHSENPLIGRDTILVSFCPQLYGLYWVKLAVAVVLAGGSPLEDTTLTGIRTRAESHLLLVGDPGTGKSQLLRFASKVIPRAVLTTGVGSTAAGLTVSALKENGEWQLEAGALVMSDGGICCIDEFNSMKDHDRTSIHEAMEQQTISVAKAGIVSKFNTRCSILAACNPKGNIDPSQPLSMSIALPSSLLSRFDLVLMLRDTVNEDWDGLVSDYILNGGYNYSKLTSSKLWSTDILQAYYAVIKKLQPKLSEDAERILSSYYQMHRRVISRNKARTTVRSLESLVRLSQGHARLMYHETVEVIDSIYAIILVDAGMESESPILNLNLNMNDIFPGKPLSNYRELLQMILDKLSLPEILEAELARCNKYKEKLKRSRFFQKPSSENEEFVIVKEIRKEQSNHEVYNTVIDGTNNFNCQNKVNQSSTSSDTVLNLDNSDNIVEKAGPSHSLYSCLNKNTDNKKQEVNAKKRFSDVEHNTSCVKRLKKISSSSDAENDEGYDTVSFNNVCSRDICPKSSESGRRNEEVSEKVDLNTSPIKKLNISSKCNILQNVLVSQNDDPDQSKTEPLKRGESNKRESSPIELKTHHKVSLKNKFKAFKFKNPKPDEKPTKPLEKIIRTLENSQNLTTNSNFVSKSKSSDSIKHHRQPISTQKFVNPTSDIEKPSCSGIGRKGVNIFARDSLNKTESFDSMQNDRELLKFIPGFNDDFEEDHDFDWDNFKEADCASSTMISSQNNRVDNKPVTINKFNSKQSSSNNSIGSSIIARLNSGPSSQSSIGMFEADDEELDLDL